MAHSLAFCGDVEVVSVYPLHASIDFQNKNDRIIKKSPFPPLNYLKKTSQKYFVALGARAVKYAL